MTKINWITFSELKTELETGTELALVDVREKADYVTGHLWRAVNIPYSSLELSVKRFIPRYNTRIILCHSNNVLSQRAALSLSHLGYSNITRFKENTDNVDASEYPMIRGDYAIAHAFGYHITSHHQTPVITANQLSRKLNAGEDILVVDTRSPKDYKKASLPNSINVPVERVIQKIPELVTNETTQIIVHCAGITRAALGAQTLINSCIPNPIKFLRDGTKGWFINGGELVRGRKFYNPEPSHASMSIAIKTAKELAQKFSLHYCSPENLQNWMEKNSNHTCYCIDVRSQEEYEHNHFPGAINIPGGELAGMTSDHLATCNANLCLIDDGSSARAEITASWMKQLGWNDVVILKQWCDLAGLESGAEIRTISKSNISESQLINASRLKQLLDNCDAAVIDVSHSSDYRLGHITGAYWTLRSALPESISGLAEYSNLVITDTDGLMAQFVAQELKLFTNKNVYVLKDGNAAWIADGLSISDGMDNVLCEVNDIDPLLAQKPGATKTEIKHQFKASISYRNSLYPKFINDKPQKFSLS